MRIGLLAAMAATLLLSGCEVFLDGLGFEVFDRNKSPIEAAEMAPVPADLPKTDL